MATLVVGQAGRLVGRDTVGSPPPAAAAPQRLPFWPKTAALVALGFFAVEDATRVDHYRGMAGRAPAAVVNGHYLLPFHQLVLVSADEGAQRVDHHRGMVGRGQVVAVTPSQPFFILWPQVKPQPELEQEVVRTDYTRLHLYRVGYQTVGQPTLYQFPPAKADQSVEPDAERADHYQRLFFGREQVVAATPSQPFFLLWQPAETPLEIEQEAGRANHNLLHLYRVGFQTVGQPWLLWGRQIRQDVAEQPLQLRPVDLTPFRGQYPAVAAAGQPWYLWKPAVADQSVEPDAKRTDYSAIFFYRFEIVIPPQLTGGEWIMRARRRRNR